jgi:hypothetical protein
VVDAPNASANIPFALVVAFVLIVSLKLAEIKCLLSSR